METKLCKICLQVKDISQFYKSKMTRDGYLNGCKMCKSKGLKIPKSSEKEIRPKRRESSVRLALPTKQDYLQMYELLRGLGYDINNGDVHKQFVDKWNGKIKVKMNYKQREANSPNSYLPDGTRNPNNKRYEYQVWYKSQKKSPPITGED